MIGFLGCEYWSISGIN